MMENAVVQEAKQFIITTVFECLRYEASTALQMYTSVKF